MVKFTQFESGGIVVQTPLCKTHQSSCFPCFTNYQNVTFVECAGMPITQHILAKKLVTNTEKMLVKSVISNLPIAVHLFFFWRDRFYIYAQGNGLTGA